MAVISEKRWQIDIYAISKLLGAIIYLRDLKNMGRLYYLFSRITKIWEGRCFLPEGHRKNGKALENIILSEGCYFFAVCIVTGHILLAFFVVMVEGILATVANLSHFLV